MEEGIRETQKKYCSRAMAVAIVGGLILILAGQKGLGKGLVLGAIFSVLNFIIMGEMLPLRMGKTKGPAIAAALISVGLRYVLLAAPLVIAIKFDQIDIITAAIGIFMIQLVIIADHFRQYLTSPHKKSELG
ncbi:MAG TPA: ATP synthase subunit I [Deltaproteobacteria bacterium]|nr:ATP synthase subunit I [Deltaproteobacteria bacterium]